MTLLRTSVSQTGICPRPAPCGTATAARVDERAAERNGTSAALRAERRSSRGDGALDAGGGATMLNYARGADNL